MKKFEFRLSSVLRLYEAQLELEKLKLAQALANERQILKSIAKRTDELRRQNEVTRELMELRSGDLRALSAYNLSAQTHIIALHEELARIRGLLQLQRETVLCHERKVKLVSKLKARQLLEWEQAVNRQLELESQEIWAAAKRFKYV
jgi:hypothetical protein